MHKWLPYLILFFSLNLSAQEYLFIDTFSYFDNRQWHINEFGFDGIGCNMTAKNLEISENTLKITLDRNPDTSKYKPFRYNSAGIQGVPFYKYGYFCTRMKSEIIKGTVSSFFLMNEWKSIDWIHKEIDIEFLGKNLESVQLTTHLINTKTNNLQSASVTIPLKFSIAKSYHDFCILWTPDSVAWFADDQLLHVEKKFVPDEPMQILMNHWNADSSVQGTTDWLGGLINPDELPSKVYYSQVAIQNLDQYKNRLTGLSNLEILETEIYPNPVNNKLCISTPHICNASIISISGKELFYFKLNAGYNELITSQLQSGIYFIKLNYRKQVVIKKFIIKKE